MGALFLIARIAGEPAAIAASSVDSVVELDAITTVPRVAAHVAGLFALRSNVLTVIDASVALGFAPTPRAAAMTALAIKHDGHGYALLIDGVDDVAEAPPPEPCPAPLAAAWARVATGVVQHGGHAVLLIDPAAFIAGPAVVA